MTSPAQADPPRELHTSFDDYARQQQLHDQSLVQQRTNTHQSTPSPAKNSNAIKNPAASTQAATGKKAASQKNSTPVNINSADETSLSNTLVGVGPAKARAIVEYRQQNGKFKQPEDLLAVKGIGSATLEKNRDRIRLN
ncbi:MAG: helix-hairpin-helix domain-containing protein [Moraxellaceae bacterium]|nr:MAG: helix-hairpin-helix domain-containing protein [Moraxellaceae bacterium]